MRSFRAVLMSLNRKYDSMPDWKRLTILVGLVIPSIVMVNGSSNGLVILMGFLWLAFLFAARMAVVGRRAG